MMLSKFCLATFLALVRQVELSASQEPQANSQNPGETHDKTGESGESLVALRLFSPIRSTSPEALRAEVVAAEAALALRAEVDGLPVVYDSPGVSISLRKVSPDALVKQGSQVEAPDGASINIPADPRVKGRYDTPVTISLTSYHAGDGINKEMPKIKFTQPPPEPNQYPADDPNPNASVNANNGTNGTNGTNRTSDPVDRVDFFMTKTSVTWHGTVNVKVPGLSANVPAKDRPWTPLGEDELYAEEKAEVKAELERLASLPSAEKLRGYRKLARQWHPDKHPPEERERVTDIFEYLQELRLALGFSSRDAS